MAITTAQKNKINKMNKASQTPSLGTIIQNLQTAIGSTGSYVVTAADSNGSSITIATSNPTNITGWIMQASRSGSTLSNPGYVTVSSRTFTVLPVTGSYVVTTGDIFKYIAW